jgi:branched-chain amino acid transport system permease protein
VVITVFIYAMLALGWNVIMGYSGQLSLAQTLFIGAGVYTPVLLYINFQISPWLGMWVGAIVSVALGIFIGYICFRYKVKGVYFGLVSIALSQIGLAFVTSFKVLGGAHELFWPVTGSPMHFQFKSNVPYYYIGLVMLGGMMFLTMRLRRMKTGYYFFAIRENEEAAQAVGIATMKYKIAALSLSAFLTAIAGTFWVQYLGMAIARDQMGLGILIVLILCALIGGLGTVFGPLLGALFIVIISTLLRWYIPMIPGLNVFIYALLLVLAILYMPEGIAGVLGRRFTVKQRRASLPVEKDRLTTEILSDMLPIREEARGTRLLQVNKAQISFGRLMAVHDFSIEVNSGEIVGLIGPNGAGKTTLFNLITGFFVPEEGEIIFKEKKVNGMRPDEICHFGIVRTFQKVKPFLNLTVTENVMLGAFARYSRFSLAREKAISTLKAVGMAHNADALAKDLTLSEQRRLEIARALATEPRLILLDESMAGLTPTEIKEAIDLILQIRESGITFLVVEHVMPIIMNLAERIVVMHLGGNLAGGTPEEIAKNQQVVEAYLGNEALSA